MIRKAHEAECEAVMRVLEGALLEIATADVRAAIDRGDVLVALGNGHVRGALVLDDVHIEAIAVVHRHRANGIGSALVKRAAERGPLTAAFRPTVRPFYESLGFEIERTGESRLQGRLSGPR